MVAKWDEGVVGYAGVEAGDTDSGDVVPDIVRLATFTGFEGTRID